MPTVRVRGGLTHVAAFVGGMVVAMAIVVHAVPESVARPDRFRTLDTFAQALSYILTEHVDETEERTLIYGAVEGMLAKLDAHSSFLPPRRYKRMRQDTEGEFGGVGITLGEGPEDDSPPIVESVVPRSPAGRAKLQVGDAITAIDRAKTHGPEVTKRGQAWHSKLRGREGSRVELVVTRAGWKQSRKIELVRERVKVPTVEWFLLEPGLGYVVVHKFQEATSEDAARALEALALSSKGPLKALILDLRGNPGGLLDQGIKLADMFLSDGKIVSIRGRPGTSPEVSVAHGPGTWKEPRMMVLVDQGSASAAEIVAGALQDHDRAEILGIETYGKGSVQTFFDLEDGSGLKLTTARYYTPSGRSLEGAGITPDIPVEAFEAEDIVGGSPDQAGADEDDSGSAVGSGESRSGANIEDRLRDDYQLRIAYQTVRGWLGSTD